MNIKPTVYRMDLNSRVIRCLFPADLFPGYCDFPDTEYSSFSRIFFQTVKRSSALERGLLFILFSTVFVFSLTVIIA